MMPPPGTNGHDGGPDTPGPRCGVPAVAAPASRETVMTTDTTRTQAQAGAGQIEDLHHITAIAAMAAMAHPLRRRLLDLISVYGPATTAQLADRARQPADIVARHLGILQDTDLIEQAATPADDKDAQPWRLAAAWFQTLTNNLPDDPVSKAVVLAAQMVNSERQAELCSTWITARESFPDEWQASAFASDMWLWLSPDELNEFRDQVCELFARWSRRTLPNGKRDRHPVLAMAYAVRAEP